MTGPLALVGGDEFAPGCDFDAELIAAVGASEVVLLPTGSAYENPGKVVEVARGWFGDLGVSVNLVPVYTRPDALVAEHVAAISSAELIYLTGTSPMHMRSVLKDTPVLDAICSAWRGGAALAGSGAGADVLCDPMVDTRGGAFTVGLGVIPRLSVIARSNLWSPDKVHRTVEMVPNDVVLVELPERTALVLEDGVWRSAGVGTPTVHGSGASASLADLPLPAD
ncbi:MAG TPA: Type 1 glutamine amidotransferase-like domain-containing protein [Acidimicrobiales bacterium]